VLIGMLGSDVLLGGPGETSSSAASSAARSRTATSRSATPATTSRSGRAATAATSSTAARPARRARVRHDRPRYDDERADPLAVDGRHSETGLPDRDVTGQQGFCTLERVQDPAVRGFDFLVRFFSKANGNLLVTVRTRDVEQVFCTAQNAAVATFADLTQSKPDFVEITLDDVRGLNSDVARMIR
jgi:hypothetical protein